MVEQGERAGHQYRGADSLHRSREDQYEQARRRSARHRGGDEQDEARNEQPLGPEPVPESTGRQDQAGEDDGVGIDDPLQSRDAAGAPERGADAFEGDIHDRDVELHDGEAEAHSREHQRAGRSSLTWHPFRIAFAPSEIPFAHVGLGPERDL